MKKKVIISLVFAFLFFGGISENVSAKMIDYQEKVNGPVFMNSSFQLLDGESNEITVNDICSDSSYRKPMLFLGKILNFVKIIVPIVIIIFGVLDFYKAITSHKDEGLSKAFKSLIIRAIAGVCIFLIPGIIQLVLNMVNEWSDYENDWCCCTECLLNGDCDVNSCSSNSCRIEGMN